MLWNEQTQHLESIFAMCCGDSIPARLRVPLHKGLTGTAAAHQLEPVEYFGMGGKRLAQSPAESLP